MGTLHVRLHRSDRVLDYALKAGQALLLPAGVHREELAQGDVMLAYRVGFASNPPPRDRLGSDSDSAVVSRRTVDEAVVQHILADEEDSIWQPIIVDGGVLRELAESLYEGRRSSGPGTDAARQSLLERLLCAHGRLTRAAQYSLALRAEQATESNAPDPDSGQAA